MITAEQCRSALTELFCDCAAASAYAAHELLVRLSRELKATDVPVNASLAKLINDCILGGKRRLWDQCRRQFGVDSTVTDAPAIVRKAKWEQSSVDMDAQEQQHLFGLALAVHRQTVKWIYEVGMILQSDFSTDEEYRRWRDLEDRLQQRLVELAAVKDMETLSHSMQEPLTRIWGVPWTGPFAV
jgi:hypothetical protein